MYYDFIQEHKRKIIGAAIVFMSVIVIWTAFILIGRIGKTPVMISVVPSDAKVLMNDIQVGNGNQWVAAGTYTVTVERDGFSTQKQSVIVTGEKKENIVALSLAPKTNEAKKWMQENLKEYKNNEKYGAIQANMDGQYFTDKNPITRKLPFTDPYYKIGYVVHNDKSITITINTTSPRYRFYAVEKIREWGYEPTDFRIDFKDFKNPLEQS